MQIDHFLGDLIEFIIIIHTKDLFKQISELLAHFPFFYKGLVYDFDACQQYHYSQIKYFFVVEQVPHLGEQIHVLKQELFISHVNGVVFLNFRGVH